MRTTPNGIISAGSRTGPTYLPLAYLLQHNQSFTQLSPSQGGGCPTLVVVSKECLTGIPAAHPEHPPPRLIAMCLDSQFFFIPFNIIFGLKPNNVPRGVFRDLITLTRRGLAWLRAVWCGVVWPLLVPNAGLYTIPLNILHRECDRQWQNVSESCLIWLIFCHLNTHLIAEAVIENGIKFIIININKIRQPI